MDQKKKKRKKSANTKCQCTNVNNNEWQVFARGLVSDKCMENSMKTIISRRQCMQNRIRLDKIRKFHNMNFKILSLNNIITNSQLLQNILQSTVASEQREYH